MMKLKYPNIVERLLLVGATSFMEKLINTPMSLEALGSSYIDVNFISNEQLRRKEFFIHCTFFEPAIKTPTFIMEADSTHIIKLNLDILNQYLLDNEVGYVKDMLKKMIENHIDQYKLKRSKEELKNHYQLSMNSFYVGLVSG